MKLQDQQVSLELSLQLKEAGYKQEGLWWWVEEEHERFNVCQFLTCKEKVTDSKFCKKHSNKDDYMLLDRGMAENICGENFVAPTVAELGEALPVGVQSWRRFNNEHKPKEYYKCHYQQGDFRYDCDANTEADARAKMWLYLKKEK